MDPCIEYRLVQLLRDSPSPVPLRDLHAALAADAGPDAGGCALLEETLRRRQDLFVVLETANPLGDATGWPPAARTEYERELAAAGVDTGPNISLVDPDSDASCEWPDAYAPPDPVAAPLRHLRDSLLRVWRSADGNAPLRNAIAAALAGCRDMPAVLRERDDATS